MRAGDFRTVWISVRSAAKIKSNEDYNLSSAILILPSEKVNLSVADIK